MNLLEGVRFFPLSMRGVQCGELRYKHLHCSHVPLNNMFLFNK